VHVPIPRTPHVAAPAADGSDGTPVPAVPEQRLRTEVVRHPDGVQQVTVTDARTGDPVSQTPADVVLHVVDAALWQLRQRKEHRDG
jgi:hypothetical protein